MDEAAWQELVRKLEPQARSHPAAYRWRVVAFAALGYALVGGVVVALVALAVGIAVLASHQAGGVIRFEIPVLALLGTVLQAFYVKAEPPDGLALSPADAPELFEMIEEVAREVGGPRVHEVLLDRDLNAGIVQNPRAGGLLGSRNYLVIGLPCLAALTADEFRAVIAHEFGHLSRKHGRFGAFVYRVYMRWMQLLASLEERKSRWAGPARRFARWYTPAFEAHALPLMRAHELEADDAAAAASGRPAAATALVSLGMASRWLDESYWPALYERVLEEPEPPRAAFAPMTREIAKARHAPGLERWYHDLLAVETGAADSHPSLAERLTHLEMDPQTVLELATRNGKASAATRYLGDAEKRLVAEHDRTWRQAVTQEWHARHAEAQSERAELEQLEARDSLTADEGLHRAQLTETFRGPEPALERYRELLGGENDPYARFAVGRLLLAEDDEEGLRWVEEAMAGAHDAVLPGCELTWAYLHTHGRDDEARAYVERWEEHAKLIEEAQVERSTLSIDDRLEPPDIPVDLLRQLGQVLLRHKRIAGAYLVRKRVELFDDTDPLHVLAIVAITDGRAVLTDADEAALTEHVVHEIEKITSTFEFVVFVLGESSPLLQRLAQVEHARLYDCARDAPSPR